MEVSRSWLWVPDQYTTTTATATKTSLKKWIHAASNFIALIPSRLINQMLADCLELNSKGLYQSSGKEKESCCLRFPSLTKPEIRPFHVVVMQWRQRNVQKSVMHVRSFCFSTINLLLFCRFSCRRPASLLKLPIKYMDPRGVLLGTAWWRPLVPPGSPNPDPISDQKMSFSTLVFRPDL